MAMLPISTVIQHQVGIDAIHVIWHNLEEHLTNFHNPYKMAGYTCKQKKVLCHDEINVTQSKYDINFQPSSLISGPIGFY